MSVRWSFIQTESKTSCSPMRAQARLERRPVDRLGRGLDADGDAAWPPGSASRAGPRFAVMRGPVVTAPSDADPTSAAYLASTPPG